MLPRLLTAASGLVLLLGCGGNDGQTAAPPSTPATPSPTPTAVTDAVQELVVSQGVRLDRVTGGDERPTATLTNLNDLAVEASVRIDVYTSGELPTYELSGQARLAPETSAVVELTEASGQPVTCEAICSYDFTASTEQAEPLGEEPYNAETTCTPEVCRFDAEPTASPTS